MQAIINENYVDLDQSVESLDNDLTNHILNKYYYEDFRSGRGKLELFLKAKCSSNCNYCYLKHYKESLYPSVIESVDIVIQNLDYILNWYKENKFRATLDIFSGNWINTEYFRPVMDKIYLAFSEPDLQYKPNIITIPDNMQFIMSDTLTELVQSYIDKFAEIGIKIVISASIDGACCDEFRTVQTDNFYKKVFDFCTKNRFRCHPMVSSTNIDHWIKNYSWWSLTAPDEIFKSLMMLEVRDQTWTEEQIVKYIEFIDFVSEYQLHFFFNDDKEEFLKYIIGIQCNFSDDIRPNYINIGLTDSGYASFNDTFNCSLAGSLAIRVGDLTIAPCHRLFYPELSIGKFKIEDSKLTNLDYTNPALALFKTKTKRSMLPHCSDCPFIDCCVGFCAGNSYEVSGNIFCPTKEVCNLYTKKFTFLIKKYYTQHIFDTLIDLKDRLPTVRFENLVRLICVVNGISKDDLYKSNQEITDEKNTQC